MSSLPLEWRTNLRGNLDLWPSVAQNIVAVTAFNGKDFDEDAVVASVNQGTSQKAPNDSRMARNTLEILALSGLAYKDDGKLVLTNLGLCVLSFLGVHGDKRFASEANRSLLADAMIRGLSVVVEYRAIWSLMRKTDNRLSNEELNRSMGRLKTLSDVTPTADAVLNSRVKGDPTLIGKRLYEDEKFSTDNANDQRKAMNPIFLLAGGGRIFMTLEASDEFRRLEDWAVPLIDRQLHQAIPSIHGSTSRQAVEFISSHAALPSFWME